MKTASDVIDELIVIEGGYSNNPDDLGGETKYGITIKVARAFGYMGPMKDLPRMTAKLIYMKEYWIKPKIAEVNKLSQPIAIELFDIAVNTGTSRAGKWLQRLLSLFTEHILKIDGQIGPATLKALRTYLNERRHQNPHRTMVNTLNAIQGCHYINLAEKLPKQRTFLFGWLRNRL